LKVAGIAFTLGTPGAGYGAPTAAATTSSVVLDASGDIPQAAGRVSFSRGSRTIDSGAGEAGAAIES
jgi:hypothetical protein